MRIPLATPHLLTKRMDVRMHKTKLSASFSSSVVAPTKVQVQVHWADAPVAARFISAETLDRIRRDDTSSDDNPYDGISATIQMWKQMFAGDVTQKYEHYGNDNRMPSPDEWKSLEELVTLWETDPKVQNLTTTNKDCLPSSNIARRAEKFAWNYMSERNDPVCSVLFNCIAVYLKECVNELGKYQRPTPRADYKIAMSFQSVEELVRYTNGFPYVSLLPANNFENL